MRNDERGETNTDRSRDYTCDRRSPLEAARLAGLGRTTIYEAIGAGALKSVKIGKRRLITIDALRSWLDAHEVDP